MSAGNPFAQQRDFANSQAVVPLTRRGVITVSGPDRLTFLDSLLSQRLTDLVPGQSREALLLDPHGHVEHAVRVIADDDRVWLLVDEGESPTLSQWLEKMIFHSNVDVTDVSSEYVAVGFMGDMPDALTQCVEQSGGHILVWRDPWKDIVEGGWQYARGERSSWNYAEALISRHRLAESIASLQLRGVHISDEATIEPLRIAAWRPRIAAEGDERLLPHEVDWLRTAVHLNKGCYRGQETVAKVHNVGRPPRRLVFLDLDGSTNESVAAGDVVTTTDGTEVGKITSSGIHWHDGPIALALVKRSTPEDETLLVQTASSNTVSATQQVIVPSDAGATVTIDRELRRSSRP